MKELVIAFFCVLMINVLSAQSDFPYFSEPSKSYQVVGDTEFEFEFERPKANGRVIFGGLVPYGEVWRTGAGPCTKISFSKAVFMGETRIEKGKYALLSIPGKDKWTIIINRDTSLYGAYKYDEALDVARIETPVEINAKFSESFSINFDINDDRLVACISWTDALVSFVLETKFYDRYRSFKESLIDDPSRAEEGELTFAAEYIIHNSSGFGEDALDLALELVNTSFKIEESTMDRNYSYYTKRDILNLIGDSEAYIKTSLKHIEFLKKEQPYQGYKEDVSAIEKEIKLYRSDSLRRN